MNKKGLIVAGAIAVGVYLLSQGKAIFSAATQKAAQKVDISRLSVKRIRDMIAHAAALKKTGEEVAALKAEEARRVAAWKVRQKADISRLSVKRIRDMIAHAAALKKTGEEVAALKAEEARRVAAWKAAQKRIGVPISRTAYIAARQKAAAQKRIRREAAQKIGKKIGKTVAQKLAQKIKAQRAVRAWLAKRQRPQIQRPRPTKKQIASRLFPGAEKSRIIPYSESSKHSYYGPKSHKVLNEGYMEKRYKADYNTIEAYDARKLRELLESRKPWQR